MSTERYAHLLAHAVAAAREAGARLTEEFARPTGPRGHGSHAEVDAEVEALLRARLLDALPEAAVLGEELGAHGPRDARFRWVLDPNDGTSSFVEGHRGSTVSLALLEANEPVLGVVYAPLAPDHDGELFAWHLGGALTRNGLPREAHPPHALRARHEALEPGAVLAASGAAERAVRANLARVHPARFVCVPSLAYRLALTAWGSVDGAFALASPKPWDLAGGHALLRGAGLALLDATGAPYRYAPDEAPSARYFAGAGPLARALATRPWETLRDDLRATPDEPEPAWAARFSPRLVRPGRGWSDAGVLARAQGCLLGQLAGDALGALVEFRGPSSIAAQYPDGVRALDDGGTWNTLAGQPTDDSEMALVAARALVRDGRFDAEALREAYVAWLASSPFDVGNTVRAGLRGAPSYESQANGSLMRIAPVAVFAAGAGLDAAGVARLAREDAALTHPHPACLDATAVFADAIAFAVREGPAPSAVYARAKATAAQLDAHLLVVQALDDAARTDPGELTQQAGWLRHALHNAFFQVLHAPSLDAALTDTVARGGDTDTNAAIAGALLGAVHGRDGVPLRYRTALAACRPLREVPGVYRPRPRVFWPADALALAEALLLAGRDGARA